MTAGVRQAIVLAAGEGRRLRPVTLTTPKPLVPFFGRPLLDWAVDALVRAGVTRIAINAWHLGDGIAARVEHYRATIGRARGLELHLSREPELLGTGGAVRHLRDWLTPGEPFFVSNSDAVLAEDPRTLGVDAPALLVTRDPAYAGERRLVATGDSRLAGLDEGGRPDAWTFCGLTLADAELPARLPDGPSCILRQGFVPWCDRLGIRLVETRAFFADTGTPGALVDAHVRGLAWASSRTAPLTGL